MSLLKVLVFLRNDGDASRINSVEKFEISFALFKRWDFRTTNIDTRGVLLILKYQYQRFWLWIYVPHILKVKKFNSDKMEKIYSF